MATSVSSAPSAATISVPAGRSETTRAVCLLVTPYGECHERHQQHRETGDEPAHVLREGVVDDPEPGEHLAEQPRNEILRNSHGRATLPRDGAPPEAHVEKLHERIQPGHDPDDAQLVNECGLMWRHGAEAVP